MLFEELEDSRGVLAEMCAGLQTRPLTGILCQGLHTISMQCPEGVRPPSLHLCHPAIRADFGFWNRPGWQTPQVPGRRLAPLRSLQGPMRDTRETTGSWREHASRAAAALLALIVVGLVVLIFINRSGPKRRSEVAAGSSCDGAAALCERRLGEVIFPGTHNSFAASEEPGWYFANQRYGISRQLDDGIRALLIDVHFGVYDPATGRVRTDLSAEGSDRNKVAERFPRAPCASPIGSLAAWVWGRLTAHPSSTCATPCAS